MYKLNIFHQNLGWVSFGIYKTKHEAEKVVFDIKRFGHGFYTDYSITETNYLKYIWEIIKNNIDNRF